MAHKHKRKADASFFDAPPNAKKSRLAASGKRKGIPNEIADDTPKAFKRLLELQKNQHGPRKGLDDPDVRLRRSKLEKRKRQRQDESAAAGTTTSSLRNHEDLKIRPHERLSDYSQRVNAALPVAGLINKGNAISTEASKDGRLSEAALIKAGQRQTKMEKRMHRMYAQWREEDIKIRAAREEAAEEAAERMVDLGLELGVALDDPALMAGTGIKKSKKKKKKGRRGNKSAADDDDKSTGVVKDDDDEDPWAKVKPKDLSAEPSNWNDVAQAPPKFTAIPKEKFKIKAPDLLEKRSSGSGYR